MKNCTEYFVDLYEDDRPLCRCPVCKGFLPRYLKELHTCKKCGTELICLPHIDEETGEVHEDWGKICPISEPMQTSDDTAEVEQ